MRRAVFFASMAVLVAWVLAGAVGPEIFPGHGDTSPQEILEAPGAGHLLGTDAMGRDMLARTMYGARISLLVAVFGTLISVVFGVAYGLVSGYVGGKLDGFMMRAVDVIYGLPYVIFVIILMVVFGRGMINIFVALGAVMWLTMARIIRAQVLSVKEREYVLAARSFGVGPLRIMLKHILPNVAGVAVVYAALLAQEVVLYESFLSFIGIGVQAPACSWGSLTKDAADVIFNGSNLWLLAPAVFLCLSLLALNVVSDRLRDRMDPKFVSRKMRAER